MITHFLFYQQATKMYLLNESWCIYLKYILAVVDGCADEIHSNRPTPLTYAHTPCLDRLALASTLGQTCLIPPHCVPGSYTALMTLFGAAPDDCHTGRAALEALALGVDLKQRSVLRCNFITLENGVIANHDGGGLSQNEADRLTQSLNDALGDKTHTFISGMTYRTFLLCDHMHLGGPAPDTLHGTPAINSLPNDPDLRRIFYAACKILEEHPINRARITRGDQPANGIWLWGGGTQPKLPNFRHRTGLQGGVVAGVPLIHGLAHAIGLHKIDVPHTNGTLYTNWEGKAFHTFDALTHKGLDFVFVHIEAADEAGHAGNFANKVAAIEYFDQRLLAPFLNWMGNQPYRILILPDHPTPVALRTHTAAPVPWLLYDHHHPLPGGSFDEMHTAHLPITPGKHLVDLLLERRFL